ncbi:hypothetical protein [Odoribacter lunatus]|uniref:hypothetical protein n=1 Tax=Odoribacter lunatus TaxID=2941335 RepID=UPI0020404B92|nr:hypothetical protein [Odoribacter lunatus]
MKKFSYKLSRMGMMAAIGAATLGACSKDDGDDNFIEQNDVRVEFSQLRNGFDRLNPDTIRMIASRPDVKNIYLVPVDIWNNLVTRNIQLLRKNLLSPAIDAAPGRVFGEGDFRFKPGAVNVDDSLWFVSKGWTVNQKQH